MKLLPISATFALLNAVTSKAAYSILGLAYMRLLQVNPVETPGLKAFSSGFSLLRWNTFIGWVTAAVLIGIIVRDPDRARWVKSVFCVLGVVSLFYCLLPD